MRDMNIMKAKVAIFIPCFNEAEVIGETIKIVRQHVNFGTFPYQAIIIVVDDGSSDDTFEVARQAGADILYRHPINRGLGAATRAGMEIAHYLECVAFAKFDADLQHDVNDLEAALKPLVENKVDILYASRFSGKINYKMPLIRYCGNRFFTFLMRRITGWKITDAQTGLMCFHRRYLTIFEMPCTYNPPQQALFDGAIKGMRYAEVPAVFHARKTGKSYIKLKYIRKVLVTLAKLSFFYYGFSAFTLFGIMLLFFGSVFLLKGMTAYFFFSAKQYLPNATLVLFAFTTGILSILFGLQSYAQINRVVCIRNSSKDYKYIILEDIILNEFK